MTLSHEYQDKFDSLKQRFNCSNAELETLLRETYKSGKGYSSATIENLIDYQLNQLDTPRRRICAIGSVQPQRRRNSLKEPSKERLSAREIRELFGTNAIFSRKNHQRVQRLKETARLLKREATREMLREGRRQLRTHARRQLRKILPFY